LALERVGARVIRGEATILGPGRVEVRTGDGTLALDGRNLVLALGSNSRVPAIEDLASIQPWTNREGTSAEDLPASLLILGGGPTGVELAQVYVRYGVPTTIVDHNQRLLARDHPRNSAAVEASLRAEGVTVRSGVRAVRARANVGPSGAHVIDLDDGTTATGHAVLLAIGRQVPLAGIGLENLGLDVSKEHPWPADGRLRVADGLYVIGDPAGPEMHTHTAHYQGEMAVRMALGENVRPDYRAIPRCTYTDPEVAFVGVSLQEAQAAGRDAFELVADLATTARGEVADAAGHVTVIVDRADRVLLGAAIAGPAATETIHEAVLAIRARVPIEVLADTIHAFPTTTRVMGGLFVDAARQLGLQ
jgi:pyruvate/2-oxoglutarate dehydrogenase complex dihydrolipoamide dehydrogenase (E3) component